MVCEESEHNKTVKYVYRTYYSGPHEDEAIEEVERYGWTLMRA